MNVTYRKMMTTKNIINDSIKYFDDLMPTFQTLPCINKLEIRMKVIYAGYAKTGTKTMTAVFREFGYNTYDWLENSWYLGKEWRNRIKYGGTAEDFRRMYEGVDAVLDSPCYLFWEEILKAYPDAKIVVSTRDEDSWYRSALSQLTSFNSDFLYILMQVLSYSGWQYFRYENSVAQVVLSSRRRWPWSTYDKNELVMKRLYRSHNANILLNAPKDKLLVYNFKDGWAPLCEFLGEEIPDKPFPHANVGASLIKDFRESHPIMIRMMREMKFSLGVLALLGAYGGYKIYENLK